MTDREKSDKFHELAGRWADASGERSMHDDHEAQGLLLATDDDGVVWQVDAEWEWHPGLGWEPDADISTLKKQADHQHVNEAFATT